MGIKYESGVQAFIRSNRAFIYRVIVFACLILGARQSAQAGGVVSNPTDADLRAAVVGGGLVTFAFDSTITLTNTLVITNNTIIDGTGHTITLSGGNAVQVFMVYANRSLALTNMTVANGAYASAGGVYNYGTLTLANCTFSNNTATSYGAVAGAVLNLGALSASGCTFFNNFSSTNVGDGADASTITISSLLSSGASMLLVNCTFFGNAVLGSPPGNTIFQSGNKSSSIINCTIAGGVRYAAGPPSQPGSMTLRNTIAYSSLGDTNSSNNLISPNPGLGPLAYNGGPTLTMALLPDSPAINAANPAFAPSTDQRRFARPYGAGYDIGAFETVFIGTNPGAMRFTSASLGVLQNSGAATITVLRDDGATGTVSVDFATSDGTAIAGQDHTPTNGTFTFTNGEISKSFVVPLMTNPPALTTKTVSLTLSNPTAGAALGSPALAVLNILPTIRTLTSADESDLRSQISAGGVVRLAFDGVVTLASPLIVSNSVLLDASGYDVTLSGSNATRLFIVQQGKSLSLQNLTLADGLALGTNGAPIMAGGPGQGGAIFNGGGTVFGTGCNFLRNTARGGVGGSNDPGDAWGNAGTGGTGQGGAMFNLNGQMFFTNSLFSENTALGGAGGPTPPGLGVSTGGVSAGAAVYSTGGLVSFVDCLISSNRSVSGRGQRFGTPYGRDGVSSGGAMEIAGGQIVLRLSLISSNTSETAYISDARGGAITQTGGTLEASDCLFAGNGAVGGVGLGISTGFPGGSAFGGGLCLLSGSAGLTNSTFSGNHAKGNQSANALLLPGAGAGGAVYSLINISLLNCTVAGNIAEAGGRSGSSDFQVQGGAYGGGLYNNGGTMMISEATLSGNAAIPTIQSNAVALGGNLYSTNGTASLINTIIAYSLSGSNSSGVLTDLGHNLSSDSSCSFAGAGSLNNADPKLGPLDDYGGPTPTMPLLAGSPAIDAGDNANFPPTDQRGRARPFGSASDIGAFESSPPYVIGGVVSGSTLSEEVLITTGSGNVSSTNHGSYRLEGLAANTYLVAPSSPNYLFLPNSRAITVGPDQIGVDFKAYHWNALSLDDVTNKVMHLVFAGVNGQTYRLLVSTNLSQWFPVATNTIVASNYFERFISMTNNGARFFRTVNP